MEAVGLQYNSTYRILICREHAVGVLPNGVETHLRNDHREKGDRLRAALSEISNHYSSTLCPITEIPLPPHGIERIPSLATTTAYYCKLSGCNEEKQSLSINRRIVEKHQSRVHASQIKGPDGARRLRNHYQIEQVSIQSLLQKPYYRPFIVRQPHDSQDRSSEGFQAVPQSHIDQLSHDYGLSRKAASSLYSSIPPSDASIHTAPWLQTTGIHRHVQGQDKDLIKALVGGPTPGKSCSALVTCND